MGKTCLLGLDVGTQSLRAALFDPHGRCLAFGVADYPTHHPRPGWAEQDPQRWWQAAVAATRQALAGAGAAPGDVRGIGLDATACTVVPCRHDGTPLRASLLWMDQRAYRESDEINATRHPALRHVYGAVSPEWMLPKALWLKRHEPDVYHAADRIVECTDWFMYRLTGRWTASLNNATVKWNYARPDGGWPRDLLGRIGLEEIVAKWPTDVVPLGRGEGRLTAQAAAALGLSAGTPVAQGGIDAYLGMLGLGAVRPGDMALIIGSSTCQIALAAQAPQARGLCGCYPDAVVEGLWALEGGQTATGSIVNWYRQHLAGAEQAEAAASGKHVYEVLDAKAAAVKPGCDGLVCLDYWQGNRSPLKDPRARGVIWGLTLSHGPGHLFRAIYEATAFGTRHILQDVQAGGFQVRRLFAGGGGVKSALWMQIHADVCRLPIHLTAESESTALGAGLTAAVAAGLYPDFNAAAEAMVRLDRVVEPDPAAGPVYDYYFQKYLDTYPRLRDLMHDMADNRP